MDEKPDYVTVSLSRGKDSTAMLLRMMEIGEPIDEVMFCDTGLEFPEMYIHINQLKTEVEKAGIKFTTLKNPLGFEYYLMKVNVKGRCKIMRPECRCPRNCDYCELAKEEQD